MRNVWGNLFYPCTARVVVFRWNTICSQLGKFSAISPLYFFPPRWFCFRGGFSLFFFFGFGFVFVFFFFYLCVELWITIAGELNTERKRISRIINRIRYDGAVYRWECHRVYSWFEYRTWMSAMLSFNSIDVFFFIGMKDSQFSNNFSYFQFHFFIIKG